MSTSFYILCNLYRQLGESTITSTNLSRLWVPTTRSRNKFFSAKIMEGEAEIDRLPIDLLAHIFGLITSFTHLAQVSSVCKKWKLGVKQSLARRKNLSFAGWKMDDDSTARLVGYAYSLKELEISRSRWGCQITDNGLYRMSFAKCISNLTSISLWGLTGITDKGVVQLVFLKLETDDAFNDLVSECIEFGFKSFPCQISRASSLQHLNIGGTFITDESLYAIANSCPQLKSIVLWSCRQVTGNGLLFLVNKCGRLESINVWGTRLPLDCFIGLLTISPALQIKPEGLLLNAGVASMLPVA